ncbi:MAG: phage portal protein [Actinobacteria bacterium]|nr:phage portal protein [Actinomycetota bacterium]
MPSIRERLGNALFGINDQIEKTKASAYSEGYSNARDEESSYLPLRIFDEAYRESYRYSREADKGWRPISKISGQKDLLPTEYDDLHKAVYNLYTTNPMAKGLIDLVTNFIIGESLNIVCDDKNTQEVVDEFSADEHNDLEFRNERIFSELILFGEQFVVCFPNFEAGNMQISQLDPINVDSIATHKDNADKEVLIIMKKVETDKGKPKAYIAWDIIPQKDNKSSKVEAFSSQDKLNYLPNEFYVGDTLKNLDNYEVVESAFCFHYKINAVTGSKRGWSDLATNVNWIAIFDEGLLNAMRQRRFRTAFIFDVTVDGAGKPEIAAKNKEITDNPPKPGTVRVHNEKEKWQTVQPNMDTKDMAEDLHQVLMHAGRALNIPEHYLGSGGDVNRASASEMGLPTIKYMKRRQKYFKAILNQIIRVAIDVNIYATKGKLSASSKIDFTILRQAICR